MAGNINLQKIPKKFEVENVKRMSPLENGENLHTLVNFIHTLANYFFNLSTSLRKIETIRRQSLLCEVLKIKLHKLHTFFALCSYFLSLSHRILEDDLMSCARNLLSPSSYPSVMFPQFLTFSIFLRTENDVEIRPLFFLHALVVTTDLQLSTFFFNFFQEFFRLSSSQIKSFQFASISSHFRFSRIMSLPGLIATCSDYFETFSVTRSFFFKSLCIIYRTPHNITQPTSSEENTSK